MKKVISIVLNSFENDSRVLKENLSLQKGGYDVKVIALHDGTSSLQEFDDIQGILVHRIKLKTKKWSKNKLIQQLKYVEFTYKVIKQYKDYCDIIHCNDLNTLPIGVILKKISSNNLKIVYDAHEYETERNGIKGFVKRVYKILEKRCIRYADCIITVSDAIANEYVKLYKIDKPALVLNAPPFIEFTNKADILRTTFDIAKEQIIFLYQGGLCQGRGIEILLDTFAILNDPNHLLYGKAVIVFMGNGQLSSLVQKSEKEHNNIFYHPAVSSDILLSYTSSADFGILFYDNSCLNHYYCSPNKMFEYIMAELPVIVSDLYEMKRLVTQNKIGCVAKENTSDGLITAIAEIMNMNYQELKDNIKNIKTIYNWEEQEKILLKIYKEL